MTKATFLSPGWMEGEHPTPAERVVDRKVCFVTNTKDACCGASKDIKVQFSLTIT